MTIGNKDAVLSAIDWDFEEFDVPAWGRVRIRSLSAKERLDLAKQYGANRLTNDDACDFFCRLIAISVVDDAGKQVFDLNGDVQALSTRNWNRLKFVAEKIMSFNGMNDEDSKTMEKN